MTDDVCTESSAWVCVHRTQGCTKGWCAPVGEARLDGAAEVMMTQWGATGSSHGLVCPRPGAQVVLLGPHLWVVAWVGAQGNDRQVVPPKCVETTPVPYMFFVEATSSKFLHIVVGSLRASGGPRPGRS